MCDNRDIAVTCMFCCDLHYKYQNLLVFFCLMEVQVEVIFLNKIIGTLVTHSLWKQTTFPEAITGFPTKWHLRNKCRNSMLTAWPIRSNTQIWVVTCYQYGISAIVSQTTFCEEIVGGFAKCCLFSQASSTVCPLLSSPVLWRKFTNNNNNNNNNDMPFN